MKASELRIGNWVNHNTTDEFQIELVDICNVDQNMNVIGIQPIELTEEWLLKFGFENRGTIIINEYEYYNRWVLRNVIYDTRNYEVHIIYSNYGKIYNTEILFSIDNDEPQFIHQTDFVHNLQNAYFLATGEELIINN